MIDLNNRFSDLEIQAITIPGQISKKQQTHFKPRLFVCKAATINCRSASDDVKLSLILRECTKAGLLWVCLQEARMIGTGVKDIFVGGVTWRVFWSGNNKKLHGVATCIKLTKHVEMKDPENISDRILAINCDIGGTKLRIINCYAPTNQYSLNEKQCFYEDLVKVINVKKEGKRKTVTFGDFNYSYDLVPGTNHSYRTDKMVLGKNVDAWIRCLW